MKRLSRRLAEISIAAALTAFIASPSISQAAPFGGQIQALWPCWNVATIALLGPPNSGFYIWTPATRTFSNGAPSRTGQWIIGQSGVPYICVIWPGIPPIPLIIWPGISISMMGSS